MARLAARVRAATLTLPAGGPGAAKRPGAVSAAADCRGSALESRAARPGWRAASPAGSDSRQAPTEERPVWRGPRWAAPIRRHTAQASAARAQSGGRKASVPGPYNGAAPQAAEESCRPGAHGPGLASAGPRSAASPCAAGGGGGCSAARAAPYAAAAPPPAAAAGGAPAAASRPADGRLVAVFLDAFDGRGEIPAALQARPPPSSIVWRGHRRGSARPKDQRACFGARRSHSWATARRRFRRGRRRAAFCGGSVVAAAHGQMTESACFGARRPHSWATALPRWRPAACWPPTR